MTCLLRFGLVERKLLGHSSLKHFRFIGAKNAQDLTTIVKRSFAARPKLQHEKTECYSKNLRHEGWVPSSTPVPL
jgi:hypothetical protein